MMTLQIHTGGINLKKKNIYSIRKLGVGIASVTLGTLLISGGVTPAANAAQHDEAQQNAFYQVLNMPNLNAEMLINAMVLSKALKMIQAKVLTF